MQDELVKNSMQDRMRINLEYFIVKTIIADTNYVFHAQLMNIVRTPQAKEKEEKIIRKT